MISVYFLHRCGEFFDAHHELQSQKVCPGFIESQSCHNFFIQMTIFTDPIFLTISTCTLRELAINGAKDAVVNIARSGIHRLELLETKTLRPKVHFLQEPKKSNFS